MPQSQEMTHDQATAEARELAKLPTPQRLAKLRSLKPQDALHTLGAAMVIALNETTKAEAGKAPQS